MADKAIAEKMKAIFASNLKYYMERNGVTQDDIVKRFELTASTVSDWVNGKKYPRIDKIQMLADFFGIMKSDLTEDKSTDGELAEYLEQLRTRPEMKMLFKLTKNATKEDVQKAVKVIEALFGHENE